MNRIACILPKYNARLCLGMSPALSPAESQRRYRERRDADLERRQLYLEKGREKWRRDREEGKRKGIDELSEREKRAMRKKWREVKRVNRARARARRTQDTPNATTWRPEDVDSSYIGAWCVVKYDNDVYPGIIIDVEEHTIQVKCMHSNGVNKFKWPSPRDDISWYAEDQLLCLILEPQALNKRSVQPEKQTWKYLEDHYID